MRQSQPDWERAVPQHPSHKTSSFFVASVFRQPITSLSAVGTLVTLLQTQLRREIARVFENGRFPFSLQSAARMNRPTVIFFTSLQAFYIQHAECNIQSHTMKSSSSCGPRSSLTSVPCCWTDGRRSKLKTAKKQTRPNVSCPPNGPIWRLSAPDAGNQTRNKKCFPHVFPSSHFKLPLCSSSPRFSRRLPADVCCDCRGTRFKIKTQTVVFDKACIPKHSSQIKVN